jgi:predicted ester cyclase
MSLEKNKAIVRKVIEAFNKRNLALLDKLMAPDYIDHTHQLRREDVKQYLTVEVKGFPDFHMTIEDIIAEGDKVWVRFKETGTHTGEYRGLAPTGKKFAITAVHNFRIFNGKVAEDFSVSDDLAFYKQLGVIEPTEKAKKLFPEDFS